MLKTRLAKIILNFEKHVGKYGSLNLTFKGGDVQTIEKVVQSRVGCFIIQPKTIK